MAVEFDHPIVPSKDRNAAAKQLAELLGVVGAALIYTTLQRPSAGD